ncbi:methionine/alanine import family NSS transporter small subunit [Lederbergia citri]|uniref:Methionine/alanine import family NSS transporter small subunit n=1 Tax=Lederbergia citri TaxID=2833580 RepID=A0A942TCF0_9BACI|nr:methionine/alanine import family NSS transporter small subunit [Lederbergia citri]MBS4195225.1 methionine/alanine import family NSS transporter small subunit [Lederbergia citri]
MTGSAITMMIIGVVIIWGGLAASVALAISKAKEAKRNS